jgi:hypothetical protein
VGRASKRALFHGVRLALKCQCGVACDQAARELSLANVSNRGAQIGLRIRRVERRPRQQSLDVLAGAIPCNDAVHDPCVAKIM